MQQVLIWRILASVGVVALSVDCRENQLDIAPPASAPGSSCKAASKPGLLPGSGVTVTRPRVHVVPKAEESTGSWNQYPFPVPLTDRMTIMVFATRFTDGYFTLMLSSSASPPPPGGTDDKAFMHLQIIDKDGVQTHRNQVTKPSNTFLKDIGDGMAPFWLEVKLLKDPDSGKNKLEVLVAGEWLAIQLEYNGEFTFNGLWLTSNLQVAAVKIYDFNDEPPPPAEDGIASKLKAQWEFYTATWSAIAAHPVQICFLVACGTGVWLLLYLLRRKLSAGGDGLGPPSTRDSSKSPAQSVKSSPTAGTTGSKPKKQVTYDEDVDAFFDAPEASPSGSSSDNGRPA